MAATGPVADELQVGQYGSVGGPGKSQPDQTTPPCNQKQSEREYRLRQDDPGDCGLDLVEHGAEVISGHVCADYEPGGQERQTCSQESECRKE